jgi:hypothetical protein
MTDETLSNPAPETTPPPPPAPPSNTGEPTSDDKLMAGLAHLSVFIFPLIVPLIVWILQREKSPWAAFHGLQALFWHLLATVGSLLFFCCYMVALFGMFPLIALTESGNMSGDGTASLMAAFGSFFLIFGVLGVFGVLYLVYLVIAIIAAVQAFQGKTFRYPIVGGIAARYIPEGAPA